MFIYVFGDKAKLHMMAQGYTLVKGDTNTQVWVFEAPADISKFSLDIPHVVSSVLTF